MIFACCFAPSIGQWTFVVLIKLAEDDILCYQNVGMLEYHERQRANDRWHSMLSEY